MVLVIDPQIAGISGDMLLCALVDLGANKQKILDGIRSSEKFLSNSSIMQIDFKKIEKHGIESLELFLEIDENIQERKGTEIKKALSDSTKEIGLTSKAKLFVESCIDTLILSESKIHGVSIDSVHFHEASSIDTLIDIIGIAIAMDDLSLFEEEIICLPIAIGGGQVKFSHGIMSNPASAILEILKNSNLVILGGPVKDELTTPTGASVLVNLSKLSSNFYPEMEITSIGYGAGKKNFTEFANVLKIVRGTKKNNFQLDRIKLLETNVDDISGEILGNLIEKLIDNAAKDVSIYNGITKKGRPTNLISVMCDDSSMQNLLDILVTETGTLGIRISTVDRFIIPRKTSEIKFPFSGEEYVVRYKETSYQGKKNFKIEFDDLKHISKIINKSIKETESLIRKRVTELNI